MIRYNWYRRNYYEYQPMGTEDVSVFHDIPLVIYENTRKYGGVKKVKHQIIGLHRRETALVEMPDIDRKQFADYNDYIKQREKQGKLMQKACMKAWSLEKPFEYDVCFDTIELKVPEQLGDFIPDWRAVHDAAIVALRTETDDIDALFVSLYNELMASGLQEFRSKYKQIYTTATERILDIKDIPEEVKRFILRISDVRIERERNNSNKDTFDFIRIRISIPTKDTFPGRKDFIKQNMQYIAAVVINHLEGLKRFTRFGIPVTCLAMKNAVITSSSELELLFELKDGLNQI